MIIGLINWIKKRPTTVSLSLLFAAWFAFQLFILTLYGPDTAKWLFYTELPPTVDPGLLFSPISHDMADYKHLATNIAFLLLVGGLLEPYVNRWTIPGFVIVGGYIGMVVTMATAPIHAFWPLAGASTGIMSLWGYTGLRMWDELDLRESFGEQRLEPQVAGFVLLAVPAIPLYEVLINGNMGHAIGMILGILYFGLEKVTT